jgi:predicted ATP-grasp superfamily ATP-dependent carboligase
MKNQPSIFKGCDFSTPVTILKCVEESYIGLGIVRSLGRLGVHVYPVISSKKTPSRLSRYSQCRFFPKLDASTTDEVLIEYLLQVAETIGRDSVLIATMDSYAKVVSGYSEILRKHFLFGCADYDIVKNLCNKQGLFFLATRHKVSTAMASFPHSEIDADEFSQNAVFPVVMKAIDWTVLEGRPLTKTMIVRNRRELIHEYSKHQEHGFPNVMLQEYIPETGGQDWMFNGYFDDQSNCLISFTGRKLRQAPVYTGYSSLGVCETNETVEDISIKFLKEISYSGVVDIDYRYDVRDGLYKILDVNPRVGASFRLFVGEGGLDVVRAMYLDKTGQEVPKDRPVPGRKWIVEDSDLRSAFTYYRHHGLRIGQWIASLRGVKEGAWFAADDPMPFLARILDLVSKKAKDCREAKTART